MAGRGEMLIATESHVVEIEGEPIVVTKGKTKVRASHPIAKANPSYFEPADRNVTYDDRPEQATAAPGEKRGERKRAAAAG